MIPAILSCVFVIYLYQSLNADPAKQVEQAEGGDPLRELSDRVAKLNDRLSKLKTASGQRKVQ